MVTLFGDANPVPALRFTKHAENPPVTSHWKVMSRWLADGDEPFPGLIVRALEGSKTPGELVLVLEETTAIFGDAVRAGRADELALLPRKKLRDPARMLPAVDNRTVEIKQGDRVA